MSKLQSFEILKRIAYTKMNCLDISVLLAVVVEVYVVDLLQAANWH